MRMRQVAVLLFASQYSFEEEKTGREVKGCSVHYILTEDLSPCYDEERSAKGYRPAKASLPFEVYDKTKDVPGFYHLDIDVQAGSDGKIKAVVTGLEFIRPLVKPKATG